MVGLTKPKPFQPTRKKRPSRKSKSLKVNTKLLLLVIWIASFVIVFGYGTTFVLKRTIFAPKYTIHNVTYSQESVDRYDEPYLYSAISKKIEGKNFQMLRMFKKGSVVRSVRKEYPFLKDIQYNISGANAVIANVDFYEPQLMVRHEDRRFGVYYDHTFELFSGSSLGSSGVTEVWLPTYLEYFKDLDGLFFDISPKELIEQVELLQQKFEQAEKIVYLPGSQRTIVLMPHGKKIYINNIRPLEEQFASYDKLKQYYEGFDTIQELDLGSLQKDRVIIKK